MKITADRKSLADTVSWVAKALPRQANVAALAGIRLHAADGRVTLSAFDYDISHEANVAAEVSDEGACLVPGRFLAEVLSALPGKTVDLELDGNQLKITSGRSSYAAQTMSLDDYPHIPAAPPSAGVISSAEQLASAVTSCLGPVDDLAATEGLRGLRLEADGELVLAGVDRAFLVHCSVEWDGDDFAATLPGKAVSAAVSGLAGPVTIGVSEAAIGFSDAERTVVIRTLSGQFAQWRRAIPTPEVARFSVVVDRDDLLAAIKRASIVSKSLRDAAAVTLDIEPDSVEVTAAGDVSGGSEVLDAKGDGSESIVFSPVLLSQALTALEPGPVQLVIQKRRTPDIAGFTIIRPAEGDIDREAVLAARKGGQAR